MTAAAQRATRVEVVTDRTALFLGSEVHPEP
jgi:hypothetical protein